MISDYTTLNCCVQSVCHPWHHPLALRGGPESCSPWGRVCPGTPGSWICQDSPGRDQDKVIVPRESLPSGAPPPLCIPELHWRDWPLIWAPPPAIPSWSSLGTCRGALSPLNISPHDITSKTCGRKGLLCSWGFSDRDSKPTVIYLCRTPPLEGFYLLSSPLSRAVYGVR